MNKLNERFQALLVEKNFPMKISKTEESYIYQGKLQVESGRLIEFAISLSKNDEYPVGQIIFNRIAVVPQNADRLVWLECLNKLNSGMGLYYYFVLGEDDRVFARYVAEVDQDVEQFFGVLGKGSRIIRNALGIFSQLERL